MEQKVIKAYKGFDENLQCRGFQYEVGKEYEMDGDIKCCENGFHACESPLEVLDYYFLLDGAKMARFCEVEQSGNFDEEKDRWVPKCVKTEYVDGDRIKEDTWYKLFDGEFKEVEI